MICCGSCFYLRKVLVPAPVPVPDPDYLAQFSTTKNFNLAFTRSALFPRKLATKFLFFDFCITFYDGSWFKSGSGTGSGIHDPVPVPLRQKVAVPVPQHWLQGSREQKNRNPRIFFGS